ncbi:tautomerase family protein [Gallaecimonas xiamenensis]|uniref:Tautomerase n=1 Tax=Gallaecimonas xiamenensis 3-C-1 TaxID=745411 RepID=K2KEH8_9GAMM|nr:tautomerase family protein [Gallaecimonas xiamenensis]EKE75680.1 hypothetical protein B3C1_06358 [Gallaecimonas xiamenensis 3-C-1]
MPMTRIALRQGLGPDYKARLSRLLQQALETHFAVPEGDCFQLFDEYGPEDRVFSRHYQSAGRSDHFLLLSITAGKPRSPEQKAALYQALAQQCQAELGLDPADLMVVVSYNQAGDWSFSGGLGHSLEGTR